MKLYTLPLGFLETNCYVVSEGGNCAVIDPGAQPEKLLAFLQEKQLSVFAVLLTHGHYDHTGAVKALVTAFENEVRIGTEDLPMLADPQKSLAGLRGMPLQDYPICEAKPVREEDVIDVKGISFTVLETPGHTRGGVVYRCGDWLFTGDTLFRESIGRTDFPGGDFPAIVRSVKKLSLLEGDFRVLPGHGPESTLAWERAHNPFMRKLSDDDFY